MESRIGSAHAEWYGILFPPQDVALAAEKYGKIHNVYPRPVAVLAGVHTSIGTMAWTKSLTG